MAYYTFITNNPFRVLGLGSSATINELVEKVSSLETGAKYVNNHEKRSNIFGNFGGDSCISEVKNAQADPVLRTAFRILWPLDWKESALLSNGKEGRGAILNARLDASTTGTKLTPCERQVALLQQWLYCIQMLEKIASVERQAYVDVMGVPSSLEVVANELKRLRTDSDFTGVLTGILISEGETSSTVVDHAFDEIHDFFYSLCVNAFVCAWDKGDYFPVWERLFKQDNFCQIDKNALQPIFDLGDREKQRIDSLRQSYAGWHELPETIKQSRPVPGKSLTPLLMWSAERKEALNRDFAETHRLCLLIEDFNGKLDVAPWCDTVSSFKVAVAESMLVSARKYFADKSTHDDAQEILQTIAQQKSYISFEVLDAVNAASDDLKQNTDSEASKITAPPDVQRDSQEELQTSPDVKSSNKGMIFVVLCMMLVAAVAIYLLVRYQLG